MSFLKNLSKLAQPKTIEAQFDFGEGEETIYLRSLTYNQRQAIFVKRLNNDGKLDITGTALHMNAELIAATLVDENGKPVVASSAVCEWDSALVDKLADFIGHQVGLLDKKADAENPSTPQS